jgi:hypothetical protein
VKDYAYQLERQVLTNITARDRPFLAALSLSPWLHSDFRFAPESSRPRISRYTFRL